MFTSVALRALVILLPLLITAAPTPAPANPTVTIASGVVVGTIARAFQEPSVTALAYLGVPFASPPIRFAPPTPPKPYQTLQAHTLPPSCLQQADSSTSGSPDFFNKALLGDLFPTPAVQSEDCLYLNIWTPPTASPTNLKAVFLWIHGGNLNTGGASLGYFDGSSLAVNGDIIVVTFNYRLNMFGFSNSPEIPLNQQNSGFLDQRMALQWVHDNIRAFGGDPSKISIAGQSAGGISVKQLLAQPPSPLTFRAAIMESQAVLDLGDPALNYAMVVAHFNCTNAYSHLACLREVSGTAIQSYISENSLYFWPVKDNTNMGDDTLPSIQSGQFASVPVYIGTNSNELPLNSLASDVSAKVMANATEILFNTLGIDISPILNPLKAIYDQPNSIWPVDVEDQLLGDAFLTCPAQTFSSAIASAGRQPVWRYYYEGDFKNARLTPHAGAYHTAEIPMVFGTYPRVNATKTQIDLSADMQQIWSGFVKSPDAGPGWPQLGSTWDGRELGVLGGKDNPSGASTQLLLHADLACVVLDPLLVAGQVAW